MNGALHDASISLVAAGTFVIVASSLGALVAKNLYHRLHFTTPVGSLGGPLIAIGLSVASGANLTTASILVPTFLLFFTGPILCAAIARMAAQRDRPHYPAITPMTAVIAIALTLVALTATVVVFTDRPDRQAITLSAFGLTLAVLFMVLQAPDVALSQIGVGTAIVPLMVMLTFRKVRQHQRR